MLPVLNFEKRRLITKLRISDQNLLIEKGRHLKIPREKRLCQVCNQIEERYFDRNVSCMF
jgi:hypothetical protein